jgi:hypothetical protein
VAITDHSHRPPFLIPASASTGPAACIFLALYDLPHPEFFSLPNLGETGTDDRAVISHSYSTIPFIQASKTSCLEARVLDLMTSSISSIPQIPVFFLPNFSETILHPSGSSSSVQTSFCSQQKLGNLKLEARASININGCVYIVEVQG